MAKTSERISPYIQASQVRKGEKIKESRREKIKESKREERRGEREGRRGAEIRGSKVIGGVERTLMEIFLLRLPPSVAIIEFIRVQFN